jgi:hypothetical protein
MEKLSATFKLMLQNVRARIVASSNIFRGQTVGPFTFALHLLRTLGEPDFAILEAFERAVGEEEATRWYQSVFDEVGAKMDSEESELRRGGAGGAV